MSDATGARHVALGDAVLDLRGVCRLAPAGVEATRSEPAAQDAPEPREGPFRGVAATKSGCSLPCGPAIAGDMARVAAAPGQRVKSDCRAHVRCLRPEDALGIGQRLPAFGDRAVRRPAGA